MLQTLWGFTPKRAYENGTDCWNNYKSRSHKWLILPGFWKAWGLWHPQDRNLGLFCWFNAFIRPSPASFAHTNPFPGWPQISGLSSGTACPMQSGKPDFSWLLKLWRCDTGPPTEHTSLIKSPISPGCGITGLMGYCGSAPIGLSSTLLTPGVLFSTWSMVSGCWSWLKS